MSKNINAAVVLQEIYKIAPSGMLSQNWQKESTLPIGCKQADRCTALTIQILSKLRSSRHVNRTLAQSHMGIRGTLAHFTPRTLT